VPAPTSLEEIMACSDIEIWSRKRNKKIFAISLKF